GLQDRVFIEPPVPFDQIIPEANKADIGFFSYSNFSRQSEFVLPNKFFEYIMAGFVLFLVDLSPTWQLTGRHNFGKLIPQHTSQAIAETINSFSREEIDRCKIASIAAAKELNWEHEKSRLITAYDDLLSIGGAQHPARELGPTPAIGAAA